MTTFRLVLAATIAMSVFQGCASAPSSKFTITPDTPENAAYRESIDQTMLTRQEAFLDCFKSLQARSPVERLDFTSEFRIGTRGKVILSKVHETTTTDPSFQACMLTIINQLKFSKPRETITVRYPFRFKKDQ